MQRHADSDSAAGTYGLLYCCRNSRKKRDDIRNILPGDGLVPLDSALGRHKKPDFDLSFPESRQWIAYGINHFDLLSHPEVYKKIKEFLQ